MGGELSEVKKGAMEINEQVKGFAREIFKLGNVAPEVLIKTNTGVDFQSVTKTSIWKNGQINYVGFLYEPENMYSKIRPEEITDVNILFKEKGHIYDVRERKYLGLISGDKEIKTKLTPAVGRIFSILPYKVEGLDVTPDKKSYKLGEVVTLSVKVRTTGREMGNHIGYLEVIGPDKKIRDYYTQKVILPKGIGRIEIPLSFNDSLGVWSINIRDVASGISKKINVNITK